MTSWAGFWLAVAAAGVTLALTAPTPGDQGYSKKDVSAFIENAADCHAEFFYTHDPQITGVGIADALRACDPFKEVGS